MADDAITGDDSIADGLDAIDEAGDGRWRVEFALQAADEPSLVVEADRIWESSGATARAGPPPGGPAGNAAHRAGSGQPVVAGAGGRPTDRRAELLDLDTEGAHRFLRDGAPVLHAAGFGVLLPSWWQRPSARLGARLQAKSRTAPGTVAAQSSLGLDSLVDYQWELALGDQPLTEQELRTLARLKTPLVRLRGQWVELDAKRLAAGLKLLPSGGAMTVGELLRLGLTTADEPDALPVLAVTADGALGDLLAGAGRAAPGPDRRAGDLPGDAAPVPEAGPGLVGLPGVARARRRPRRRHGAGQDRAAAGAAGRRRTRGRADAAGLPDVAGRQLAAGGGEVRPGAAGARAPRRRAPARQEVHRGGTGGGPGGHHVLDRRPGRGRARRDRLASGGARRGAGDQERRDPAGRRGPRAARPAPDRGHRYAGGEPARRPLVASWTSPTRGCSAPRRPSRSGTPSRSSGTATTRRPSGCAGSPARSCCGG